MFSTKKTKRDASQRIADSRSTRRVVRSHSWSGVPSRRIAPRQSARVQFVHNQITAEVISPGATVPPSVPHGGNERRTRRGPASCTRTLQKLEAAVSAVGGRIPLSRRCERLCTEGGGCEGQACRCRDDFRRALKEGEEHHASFCAERVSEEPPPTVPVDFVAELAQLSSLVAELQREREELRSELGQRGVATPPEEGRPRKSICVSSVRVKILRGVRVGESSHQGRCVQGGGISIRLKWTVILTTTRGCCPPTIRRSWGGRMWCARRLHCKRKCSSARVQHWDG